MGFLKVRENKISQNSTVVTLEELLGAMKNNVTENNIMNIPAIASSIDLVSDIISMLDLRLYKKIRCDKVEEIEQDHRLTLLNLEPNALMTGQQFKRQMAKDLVIHGNSYANIERLRNEVKSLYYVEAQNVSVLMDTEIIHKDGRIFIGGQNYYPYEFLIFANNSKNGLEGIGILKQNEELLALALLEQKFLTNNLKTGGNLKGFFTTENKIMDIDKAREDLRLMLEGGNKITLFNKLDYKAIQSSNVDMQLLQNRKFTNEEIRKIFNIPGELKTDNDYKMFIKACITPKLNLIENALNKALLLQKEKNENYYFKFDVKELTKASIKERFEAYQLALKNGIKTRNEVRAEEDLESIEGMDIISMSLGEVIFDIDSKTYFTPNTKQQVDLSTSGGDKFEKHKEKLE